MDGLEIHTSLYQRCLADLTLLTAQNWTENLAINLNLTLFIRNIHICWIRPETFRNRDTCESQRNSLTKWNH